MEDYIIKNEVEKNVDTDCGNCSVCWKLRKINNKEDYLKMKFLIKEYQDCLYDNKYATKHKKLFLETSMYDFLYGKYSI